MNAFSAQALLGVTPGITEIEGLGKGPCPTIPPYSPFAWSKSEGSSGDTEPRKHGVGEKKTEDSGGRQPEVRPRGSF